MISNFCCVVLVLVTETKERSAAVVVAVPSSARRHTHVAVALRRVDRHANATHHVVCASDVQSVQSSQTRTHPERATRCVRELELRDRLVSVHVVNLVVVVVVVVVVQQPQRACSSQRGPRRQMLATRKFRPNLALFFHFSI